MQQLADKELAEQVAKENLLDLERPLKVLRGSSSSASSALPAPPLAPPPPHASASSAPLPGSTPHLGERWRDGRAGGRERWGNSGGSNRAYYKGYYRAKGQGRGALDEYIQVNGPPPSQGGCAYHHRKR